MQSRKYNAKQAKIPTKTSGGLQLRFACLPPGSQKLIRRTVQRGAKITSMDEASYMLDSCETTTPRA